MLDQFYQILGQLGEPVPLGAMSLGSTPRRGVYFFFEPGEKMAHGRDRVVRVGTHGLKSGAKSTLGGRLAQHRGSSRGGNHRGSIFRLLLGQALLAKSPDLLCPSWGFRKAKLRSAAERLGKDGAQLRALEKPVEKLVSDQIANMAVIVLGCDDEPGPSSLRGYVERNAIALLAAAHRRKDVLPSTHWLGQFSDRDRVRGSGLWNQRHTDDAVDLHFADRFAEIVSDASNARNLAR